MAANIGRRQMGMVRNLQFKKLMIKKLTIKKKKNLGLKNLRLKKKKNLRLKNHIFTHDFSLDI